MSLRTWDSRIQQPNEILSSLSLKARHRRRAEESEGFVQPLPNSFANNRGKDGNAPRAGSARSTPGLKPASATYTYWSKTRGVLDVSTEEKNRTARCLRKDDGSSVPSKDVVGGQPGLNRVPAREFAEVESHGSRVVSEDFGADGNEGIGSGSGSFACHKVGDFPFPLVSPTIEASSVNESQSPREGGVLESRDTVLSMEDLASAMKPQTQDDTAIVQGDSCEVRRRVELARNSWPRQVSKPGGRKLSPQPNRPTSFELELPSTDRSPFPRVFGQWLIDQALETLKQNAAAGKTDPDAAKSASPTAVLDQWDDEQEETKFLAGEKPLSRLNRVPESSMFDDHLYDTEWTYERGSSDGEDEGPLFIAAIPEAEPNSGPAVETILPKRCRKGIDGANLRCGVLVRSRDLGQQNDEQPLSELLTARTASKRASSKPAKRFFRFPHMLCFVAGIVTSAASLALRRRDGSSDEDDANSVDTGPGNHKYSPFDKASLFHSVM